MLDLENEKISTFLRTYAVKIPNHRYKGHNPVFVNQALRNVDKLLEIQASTDPDIVGALEDIKEQWAKILLNMPEHGAEETNGTPAEPKKTAPRFNWNTFIQHHHNVREPDTIACAQDEDAFNYAEAIRSVINGFREESYLNEGGASELPPKTIAMLQSWERGWKAIGRKLKAMNFGGEERRGPPIHYLQKKKAKSAESAKVRAEMRKKSK
jgi:hypothetical protein